MDNGYEAQSAPPPLPVTGAPVGRKPTWLRILGLFVAVSLAKPIASSAGRAASDALLGIDQSGDWHPGAGIAGAITVVVVVLLFELLATVYARKRWLGITLLLALPLTCLTYVGVMVTHNQAVAQDAPSQTPDTVESIKDDSVAPARPALLPPVEMDDQFRRDHVELQYGDNAFLFEMAMLATRISETKSKTTVATLMPYQALMEKGLADARNDPKWMQPPQ